MTKIKIFSIIFFLIANSLYSSNAQSKNKGFLLVSNFSNTGNDELSNYEINKFNSKKMNYSFLGCSFSSLILGITGLIINNNSADKSKDYAKLGFVFGAPLGFLTGHIIGSTKDANYYEKKYGIKKKSTNRWRYSFMGGLIGYGLCVAGVAVTYRPIGDIHLSPFSLAIIGIPPGILIGYIMGDYEDEGEVINSIKQHQKLQSIENTLKRNINYKISLINSYF